MAVSILYAEDDVMMQKVVVKTLVRLGYELTTVEDGKEAIEALEAESFDLIILDLFMPKLSGYDVVESVRQDLKLSTPILILSRSHMNDAIKKAYEVGADDYIEKPFQPEELVVKITRLLASVR